MSTGTYDNYLYYEVSGTYISITGGTNDYRVLVIPPNIVHSGISYNVEEISENAFTGQHNWTRFDASNSNLITIGDQAIKDCHGIQSIDLNNSRQLINIGSYAFFNDYNASSLNLQDCISLQYIQDRAFYACFNITSVNFIRCYSLQSLGLYCFGTTYADPGKISSINFQDSPFVDFSNNVFDNQQQLTSLTLGGNIPTTIPITASNTSFSNYYAYNWSNFDISFGGYPVTYIYSSFNDLSYDLIDFSYITITGGEPSGTLTIPPNITHAGVDYKVTSISSNSFNNNPNITSIDASNSNLAYIWNNAFSNCQNNTILNLSNSNSLAIIFPYAFLNNTSLTSVNFSGCSNLEEITQMVFKDCNLNTVDFTDCNIKLLGYHLFDNNINLSSITFSQFIDPPVFYHNGIPTTDISFGANIGINNSVATKIYAYNWSNFDISFGGLDVIYIYKNTNIKYRVIYSSYISITGGEVSGILVIPATIPQGTPSTNYEVQEISGNAFLSNSNIIALDASNSNLKYIRNGAFSSCQNLLSVDFSGSTSLQLLENVVFMDSSNINQINFTGCYNLTTIENDCFANITQITSYNFNDCFKLNAISTGLFNQNINLTSITFGSVQPPNFYDGGISVANILLGKNIPTSAKIYVNWWSNFPSTFGEDAENSPSLDVIKLYNDISYNINYNIVDGSYVDIISYNSKLESALGNQNILNGALTIPDNIDGYPVKNLLPTQNGELGTFQDLENITSISLPQSIETIMGYTFRYAYVTSNITQINFQNLINLKTIGWGSFSNNVNLVSVDLSGCISLENIYPWAFNDCTNLTTINLTGCNSLTTINREAFRNTNLQTIVIPSGVTLIESNAFNGCTSLETIDLGNCSSMTTIVDNNYQNLPSLTSIILNASLQTIGQNAFSNCSNMVNINLGICTSLTSIGENAFENCTSLQTIDLTNLTNLTTFSNSVFKNSGIQSIILPASLNQQGETTFENCLNLNSITYLGPCPSDLNTTGTSLSTTPFKDLSGNAKIYVYYEYSSTNPDNTGPGPYYLTEYQRASTIPVIIIDPPPPPPPTSKHCCPKPAIVDKRQYIYQNGQNASKLFTRINSARRSRNKYSIPISQSNITNICDTNLNLMINTNVSVSYSGYQQHIDNINRLNNSKNCQILGLKFPRRLAISSLF